MAFTLDKLTATREGDSSSKKYRIFGEYNSNGTNLKVLTPIIDNTNTSCTFEIDDTVADTDCLKFDFSFDFSNVIQNDGALKIILQQITFHSSTTLPLNLICIHDLKYPPPYKILEEFSKTTTPISGDLDTNLSLFFSIKQLELTRQTGSYFNIKIILDYSSTTVDFVARNYQIEPDKYNLPSVDVLMLFVDEKPTGSNPENEVVFTGQQFDLSQGLPMLITSDIPPLTNLHWKGYKKKECLIKFK